MGPESRERRVWQGAKDTRLGADGLGDWGKAVLDVTESTATDNLRTL